MAIANALVGERAAGHRQCFVLKVTAAGQRWRAPVRSLLLTAYLNHVRAQAGKALSDEEARILTGLARRLP